jgi:hypothetical protein
MLEAFKVGILIALNNKASYGLAILARDFAKTDAHAQRLKATIKAVSLLTIGGAGLVGAGLIGLRSAEKWMEAGERYTQAFARFQALNLGAAVNRDADHFAQSAQLLGVTATDLMTTVTDLHTVFGKYEHARGMAPLVARMEFANKAVFGDATKFNSAQALSMGKVIEMRGGFKSEAEMKRQIDFMQHVMAGTGGRVMPSDYLNFLKTSGVAGRLQDNKNFYYQMEPLIQEMGGNRVGTALMSAYQNLGQGRTTVRTARELQRLGLLNPGAAEYNSLGQLNRIKPGGVKGGDMVASDPKAFLQNILLPAFAKKGITGEKPILNEIATVFTNRTAASLFSLIYLQASKIEKNMAVNAKAMGVAGLLKMGDKTPAGIKLRADAAWENLKTQLGLKVIPIVMPMIEKLANGLQALASAAQRHPTLTRWLVMTAMGLSALSVVIGGIALVAGAVLLISAALGGAVSAGIVLAITGITVGLVAFGAAVLAWWPKVVMGLEAVGKAIFGFFGFLWEKIKGGWKAMVSEPWENFRASMRQMAHIDPNGKDKRSAFYTPPALKAGPAFHAQAAPKASAAAPAPAAPGPWQKAAPPPPTKPSTVTHVTNIHLDGKQIARAVSHHQGNAAAAPATGPTRFDGLLSPFQPSMSLSPG